MFATTITRPFVRELAGDYGLGASILEADAGWCAYLTADPAGRRVDGAYVLSYQSWNGVWLSGNGVELAPHDVRRYLARVTGQTS
jgi:hypothetical protein